MIKRNLILLVLTGFLSLTLTNCTKDDSELPFKIEGLTFENYPKVDCSTSARALSVMTACKLLELNYVWEENLSMATGEWGITPNYNGIPEQHKYFFLSRLMFSQTHGAFENLIDGKADIIITHRTVSPDEKTHAESLGVTLIEKSIALDAFVFIINKNNPVKSLAANQIQKIYTGEITNWAQAGGNNADIKVFTRPRNSGSEEIFRTLVMNGIEPADFPESDVRAMITVFNEVLYYTDAICYTFNNYKNMVARIPDSEVPKIAVNGIFPDERTVKNRTYPFIAEVHVAIRSDLDKNSMAYKLFEWLQSESAKSVISECGFIPK